MRTPRREGAPLARTPLPRLMLGLLVLLVLLAGASAARAQRSGQPEVSTQYGRLRGTVASVEGLDQPVIVFRGIPFARPPVGALRFSPPQPPEPWPHLREAAAHPPMCLQYLDWLDGMSKMMNATLPKWTTSEDCLYLNVFTPDVEAKLPVMVWIHGGGLVLGGAPLYDGSALSAYEKVVVVVIQYRLGLPGFFSTGSKEARGNWGLLDQVAALTWVQENIGLFGGDPSAVTIFGESAGGFSVGAQILSPLSKGLFHRAIAESGVAQLPGLLTGNPLEVIVQNVANFSGCETSSSAAMMLCLRSKTEEELAILNAKLTKELGIFPAVVDGEFIPKAAEELLAAKEFNAVPYLIGVNNDEYGWIISQALGLAPLTEAMDRQTVTAAFQQAASTMRFPPPEAVQTVLDEYLGDTEDPEELRKRFQDLMGDALFVIPALQAARAHQESGAPVYFYEFQHRPSAFKDTKPDFVKADHGDEIAFLFGVPFLSNSTFFFSVFTEEEKQLSKTMMRYWGNFARNGNPNGQGLVEWPRYGQKEEYLELNLEQKKAEKLKESKADFWLKTLPEKMKKITEGQKSQHVEL